MVSWIPDSDPDLSCSAQIDGRRFPAVTRLCPSATACRRVTRLHRVTAWQAS